MLKTSTRWKAVSGFSSHSLAYSKKVAESMGPKNTSLVSSSRGRNQIAKHQQHLFLMGTNGKALLNTLWIQVQWNKFTQTEHSNYPFLTSVGSASGKHLQPHPAKSPQTKPQHHPMSGHKQRKPQTELALEAQAATLDPIMGGICQQNACWCALFVVVCCR